MFKMIETAIRTTHGPNHKFELNVDKVFSFDDQDLATGHKPAVSLKPASVKKPAPQQKKALDLISASALKSVQAADQNTVPKSLIDDHNLSKNLDRKLSFHDNNAVSNLKPESDQEPKTLLLWHGTNSTFVPGILRRGFSIPTTRGQLHGPAVYFTPCASKASKYCNAEQGSAIEQVVLSNLEI